jgi:rubredoxin
MLKKMTKAELLKIVEKLPLTKDGVPVVPDYDSVYHPDLLDDQGNPSALAFSDYDHNWVCPYNDTGREAKDCYSTVELARQAKGAK